MDVREKVERVEADNARMEEFVSVTVPRIVDEQSGTVTRKLKKAHETFDIENAKIAKREQKVRRVWWLQEFQVGFTGVGVRRSRLHLPMLCKR